MPAFPIHTLFGWLAAPGLNASSPELGQAVGEEQALFLQACTVGGDFQLMPYFKGVYPHACRIDFYGVHYGPVMHAPSEALAYYLAETEYGVDLSAWWEAIPHAADDGGALALIADDGGDMAPVFHALRPVNARYLVWMYGHPAYALHASPGEDPYAKEEYRSFRYGPDRQTLDEIRAYAQRNGFLDTLSKGQSIYQRLVKDAAVERSPSLSARNAT